MSVYPEFLQHIQQQGLYVDGYNYEEMYNIMVNNLKNIFIPSFCFIYSYDQINELYDYLDNLLHSTNDVDQINNEDNEDNEPNQTNQNHTNDYDFDSDIDSIYSDSDVEQIENTQSDQTAQNDQSVQTPQQMLNTYLANMAYQNNTNMNHTNIIYYDNTSNMNQIYSNNTNLYNITYLNNMN